MVFRVGQRVVCINSEARAGYRDFGPTEKLTEGAVYTVARVFIRDNVSTLHLIEIARDKDSRLEHGVDVGWRAARFRPVVERKTDISIFTKMLTDKKVDA